MMGANSMTVGHGPDTGASRFNSGGISQAIGRRKWVFLVSVATCLSVGGALAARQTPVFASHSQVLFEQYVPSGPVENNAAIVTDTYLNAQAEQIVSAPVLEMAAATLAPRGLKIFDGSANIASLLQKGIEASVGKKDGIITVSFACPVASDSAAVVNAVVEAYRTYERQARKTTAYQAVNQLQQDKDLRDAQVMAGLQQIQDFKKTNPDFALDDGKGSNILNQKLARLSDQLTDAQANTLTLQARYDVLAAQRGPRDTSEAAPEKLAVDDTDVDAAWVQGELNRASANVDALTARGLPATSSEMQDARAYLARLHRKLTACQHTAAVTELARMHDDVDLAQRRQADLQSAFDTAKKAVMDLNAKTAVLAGLQDQLQRSQQASDELGTKIKQIDVAQDIPLDVRVIEPASPAIAPRPTRYVTIGFAAIAGMIMGLGLSLGMDVMDHRLRSPAEIGGMLGLPVLGVIPHQAAKSSTTDFGLIAHTDPMSDVAEAARSVRTALFAASRMTPIKTVLISSPSAGDGRSTFAANLAIAMAKAGSRTLLIDTNAGEPAIQQIFAIKTTTGLTEVLTGQLDPQRAIRRTPVEGLEVLPAGQMPMNSADLLNSPEFSNLIEALSTQYQCVLLDSPAVLSAPDARILGAFADITLYVVRAGATTGEVADEGLDQLLSVGSRVLGAVVNDVSQNYAMRRSRSTLRFMEIPGEGEIFGSAAPPRARDMDSRRNRAMGAMGLKKLASSATPDVDVLD